MNGIIGGIFRNVFSWIRIRGGSIAGVTLSASVDALTFPTTIAADHSANGIVISSVAGENLAFGDLCYRKSDGKYWKADANAASTMPGAVMALETISAAASGSFLKIGFARDDSWSWTVGGLIYASTDAGGLTQTAPSGSGDQVQVVGYAYSATVVYFNPDGTLIEVA